MVSGFEALIGGSKRGYGVTSKDTGFQVWIGRSKRGCGVPSVDMEFLEWIGGSKRQYRHSTMQGSIQAFRVPSKDAGWDFSIQGGI